MKQAIIFLCNGLKLPARALQKAEFTDWFGLYLLLIVVVSDDFFCCKVIYSCCTTVSAPIYILLCLKGAEKQAICRQFAFYFVSYALEISNDRSHIVSNIYLLVFPLEWLLNSGHISLCLPERSCR